MSNRLKLFYCSWLLFIFTYSPVSAEKIKISFSSITGSQSPLWIAKEQGFFKKHGLDVDLVYIVGGRVVAQAMMSGEIKFGFVDLGNIVRANLAGGGLVLVAVLRDKANFFLVSLKEITDIQQLKGKRVGIGQFGGPPDYMTRMVLEKHGLRPDKDVSIVQMLVGQGGRLAALQAGVIESVVINPPLTLVAKKMGFNLLMDYSEALPPVMVSGLTTTRKFIKENPKTVENAVKATVDAVNYILSNEEGAMKIIGRYMNLTDQALLKEYYRQLALKEISKSFFPDVKGVEFFLAQEHVPPGKARPEDFIDPSFLTRLKKEGYF